MQRWGYITAEPGPPPGRPGKLRSGALIRLTQAGRQAREVWRPLPGVIEQRWRERLGSDAGRLRDAPAAVARELPAGLPGCLPILGYGLLSRAPGPGSVTVPDPAAGRGKVARLTAAGEQALGAYRQLPGRIEVRWRARYGADVVGGLRDVLERLAGEPGRPLPLRAGLRPDPGGWRESGGEPRALPHYPMVLHRGGFPDGS